MYDNYEIILSDSESLMLPWRDRMRMQTLAKLIVNFADCLDGNGRFKINGTKYFWVETIKPGTVKRIDENTTERYFDGLYRLKAYGGYEWGGRGCFYEEVPTRSARERIPPDCACFEKIQKIKKGCAKCGEACAAGTVP